MYTRNNQTKLQSELYDGGRYMRFIPCLVIQTFVEMDISIIMGQLGYQLDTALTNDCSTNTAASEAFSKINDPAMISIVNIMNTIMKNYKIN